MGIFSDVEDEKKKKRQDVSGKTTTNTNVGIFEQVEKNIPEPKKPSQVAAQEQKSKNIFQKAGEFLGGIGKSITPQRQEDIKKQEGQGRGIELQQAPLGTQEKQFTMLAPNLFDSQPQMSAAKPKSIWDKISNFLLSPFGDKDIDTTARAQAAYAVTKVSGEKLLSPRYESYAKQNKISVDEAKKRIKKIAADNGISELDVFGLSLEKLAQPGGNIFRNSVMEQVSKELGVRTDITTSEFTSTVLTIAIGTGVVTAPIATLKAVGIFSGVNEIKSAIISGVKGEGVKLGAGKSLSDLVPEDTSPLIKNGLDILDFMAMAGVTHQVFRTAPKIGEALTKEVITKYGVPETLTLDAQQVQSIYQTGAKPKGYDLYKKLGLSSSEVKIAVKKGISVEFPTEKIVTIQDNAIWAKLKQTIGLKPTEPITNVIPGGEPKVGRPPAGLLEGGISERDIILSPDQLIEQVNYSDLKGTELGKQLIEKAQDATDLGVSIRVIPDANMGIVLSGTTPQGRKLGFEFVENIKLGAVEEERVNIIKDFEAAAKKYTSAEDFAIAEFDAKPTDKIGLVDPDNIEPRDPVNDAAVNEYIEKIKAGEEIEPIRVTLVDDKLLTTDGTQRAVAFQKTGEQAPVILAGEATFEGLEPIEEVYNRAAEKAPEAPVEEAEKIVTTQGSSVFKSVAAGVSPLTVTRYDDGGSGVYIGNRSTAESFEGELNEITLVKDLNLLDLHTKEGKVAYQEVRSQYPAEPREDQVVKVADAVSYDLKNKGYDGVIFADKREGEAVIFDPANLKVKGVVAKVAAKMPEKPQVPAKPVTKPPEKPAVKPPAPPKPAEKPAGIPVEVPRRQLPVGEGREKASRLEKRIKDTLSQVPEFVQEEIDPATYRQVSKAENIAKAADYVVNNTEEALAVLSGKVEAPEGILTNSIFVALYNLAKEDIGLATRLATLQATRLGQEISVLTEIDPDSPVNILSDIVKIREQVIRKKLGKTGKEVIDKMKESIDREVKTPNLKDWDSFLESIRC